ncbi:outer membrane lipid asymmetry maintenance protein MlaD [Neisseria leonii]|uniref:Outer membrane lipid asymmetry maintenance protein MlaD n=1 Tax=Neisseria leonii TaxID=2995413 RepID=A0A9X4E4T7_9NEIS|nr:outer membrane lipid asymmetry maintenance protein MlaD [Neisseria sp. 51.81]MDD9328714.1 outer membrane lipid asymmetry maintenance protein MlaD [Neisseria sp. 51.81]
MKRSNLELLVGLFVMVGIAALGFLSFRVAGGSLTGSGKFYTVYADFSDIGGLKPKAPVKAAGVLVGRVSAIRLDPQSYQAKVAIELDPQYRFSADTSAQILTSGLLGEQYIGLQQGGDTDNLAAGDTITLTSSALVLENLIGRVMTAFTENSAKTTAYGNGTAGEPEAETNP